MSSGASIAHVQVPEPDVGMMPCSHVLSGNIQLIPSIFLIFLTGVFMPSLITVATGISGKASGSICGSAIGSGVSGLMVSGNISSSMKKSISWVMVVSLSDAVGFRNLVLQN